MAREDHIGIEGGVGYCRPIRPIPLEVTDVDYIWLFILFFAVLAAAWFYLQRAKARPTTTVTTTTEAPTPADVHTESTDQRPAS